MFSLEHHVRVWVFQVLDNHIQYLLLRQKPLAEWPLGPVIGAIAPHEHMRDTVVREVREETGIQRPVHLMDLSHPTKELFGDIGLVEWPFAYQAGMPDRPVHEVRPGPKVGEFAWMSFDEAFRCIETSEDRDSLVDLQLRLHSA